MHDCLRLVRVTAANAAGRQTDWDVCGDFAGYSNLAVCDNLPVRGAEGSKTGGAVKGPFWESQQKRPEVRRSVALNTANSREINGFRL
jgi:hypothetical protein